MRLVVWVMNRAEQTEVFSHWMTEHRGLLFKVIRANCRRPAEQDDLFQEIAVQLWKSVPKFRGESKTTTWIYRVALFTAVTWNRNEKKYRNHEDVNDCKQVLTVDSTETDPRLEYLYERIRRLKVPDRSITLLLLDGYRYSEIASILGQSEGAVAVRISRIKAHLARSRKDQSDEV